MEPGVLSDVDGESTWPYTCLLTFISLGICPSFSKFPMDIALPRSSFFTLWLSSYLAQLILQPQVAVMLNNCHRLFSTNTLGIGFSWQSKLQVRLNNDCKYGFSRELQVKSNGDIDLDMAVSEKFKIKSVPFSGCKNASFQGS